MTKKLLALALSIVLLSIIFTACKNKVTNEPDEKSQKDISLSTLTYRQETLNSEIAVSDPTVFIEDCETPDPTEVAVSDPTKKHEENINPYGVNYLSGVTEAVFYSSSKSYTLTSVERENILRIINEELNGNWWDVLRLAVLEEDILNLKENNSCLEITFNSVKSIQDNCDCIEPCTYEFDKILIVLDGENQNTIYFSQNGKYKHGPIKFPNSNLSKNLMNSISY